MAPSARRRRGESRGWAARVRLAAMLELEAERLGRLTEEQARLMAEQLQEQRLRRVIG